MKKLLLILLALITVLTFCACGETTIGTQGGTIEEVILEDGIKLAGKDAGNPAVIYSFHYPEEWTMIRNDGTIEIQYDCNDSTMYEDMATVAVYGFTLPDDKEDQTAVEYWNEFKEQDLKTLFVAQNEAGELVSTFQELDVDYYGETATPDDAELEGLDDTPAIKVKYKGTINRKTYVYEQIICCRYGVVYYATLGVPEEYYDKVSNVMPVIKDSFDFQD